jgi:hypothetical protein
MISWISVVFVVISPFAFLILLIWVFSLFILVRFARGLSILFIFPKNQLFVSLILCMFFFVVVVYLFVSISLIGALIFIISLLLLFWDLLVLVFLGVWDGLHACKASTLLLEPLLQSLVNLSSCGSQARVVTQSQVTCNYQIDTKFEGSFHGPSALGSLFCWWWSWW